MHPLFITGLVFAGVTAMTMPYYCKITFDAKDKRTLTVKMILSSLFLLTAILSLFSCRPVHGHMFVMLLGFLFGYVGDYILGKSDRASLFAAGSCCFAVGHILYAVAFSMVREKLFPDVKWFNGLEIGVFLAITALMLLIIVLKKPAFDPLFWPMFVYCLIATLMVTKATGLAVRLFPQAHAILMAPIGAGCFLLSDYMLGMMRFKMHDKTYAFKSVCTVSYYVAQTLMALTMFTLIRY